MAAHQYAPIPDVDVAADSEQLQKSVVAAKKGVSFPNRVVAAAFSNFCDSASEMLCHFVQNIAAMIDQQSGWLEPHNAAKDTVKKILAVAELFDETQVEGLDELSEVLVSIKQKSASFRSENRCCGMFVGVHAKQIAEATKQLKGLGVKLKLQEFLEWRSQPPRNQSIETVPPPSEEQAVLEQGLGVAVSDSGSTQKAAEMEGGVVESGESDAQCFAPLVDIDEQEMEGGGGFRCDTLIAEPEEGNPEVGTPEAGDRMDEGIESVSVEGKALRDSFSQELLPTVDLLSSGDILLKETGLENVGIKSIERQGSIPAPPAVGGEEVHREEKGNGPVSTTTGTVSSAPAGCKASKIPTPPPSPLPAENAMEDNSIKPAAVVVQPSDAPSSKESKETHPEEAAAEFSGVQGVEIQGGWCDSVGGEGDLAVDTFELCSKIASRRSLEAVGDQVMQHVAGDSKQQEVEVEAGAGLAHAKSRDQDEGQGVVVVAKHPSVTQVLVESQHQVYSDNENVEVQGKGIAWPSTIWCSRIPGVPVRSQGGGSNDGTCDQSKVVGCFRIDKARGRVSKIPAPPSGRDKNRNEASAKCSLSRELSCSSKTMVESIPEEPCGDICHPAAVVADEGGATEAELVCSVDAPCIVSTTPSEEGVTQSDGGIFGHIEARVLDGSSGSMCTIVKGGAGFCGGVIVRHVLSRKRIPAEFGDLVFTLRAGEVGCHARASLKILDLFHRMLLRAGVGSGIGSTSNLSGGWDVESLIYQCRELLAGRRCLLVVEDVVNNQFQLLEPLLALNINLLVTCPSAGDIDGLGDASFSVVEINCLSESDAEKFFSTMTGESCEEGGPDIQCILDACQGNSSGLLVSAALVNYRVEWEAISKQAAMKEISSGVLEGAFDGAGSSKVPHLSACLTRLPECDQVLFARLAIFPPNTAIPAVIIKNVCGESEMMDLARKLAIFETLLLVGRCGEGRWLLDSTQHALADQRANLFDASGEGILLEESKKRLVECVTQPTLFKAMFPDGAHLLIKYFTSLTDTNVIQLLLAQGKAHLDTDQEFVASVVEFLLATGDFASAQQLGDSLLDRMSHAESHPAIRQAMKLSSSIAIALGLQGCRSQTEITWRMICNLAQMMGEPQSIELADSMTNLALAVLEDARFDEAVELFSKALAHWEAVLGSKHPKTVSVRAKLQETQFCRGESIEMEPMLREVLSTKHMIWGKTSPRSFQPIEKLVPLILVRDSNVDDVLALHAQLAAIIGQMTGDEQKRCAQLLWELTRVIQAQGNPHSTENDLLPAFEKLEAALQGMDEDLLVEVLGGFGSILDAQGEHQQAISKLERAVSILERTHGENDVSVASGRNNLACALFHAGDLAGAESLHRKALEVRRKAYGEVDERVAVSIGNLGNVMEAAQRHAEAEECMRKALEVWIRLMGEENALVATALNNLGMVLESRNKLNEAEAIHRKALELWVKINGENDLTVASAKGTLANVLEGLQKYSEAEALYRRALDMFEGDPNADEVMIASAMNNLALALENSNKLDEAESIHRKALSLWKQAKGEHNPDVITSMTNLAFVLEGKEDFEGAEALLRKAVKLCKLVHGLNHPEVCGAMENLAGVLESGDKQDEANKLRVSAMFWKQKYYQSQP